jgi:hypothetical protein
MRGIGSETYLDDLEMRCNCVSYFTGVDETLDEGVYVLYQGKIACSHGECNAVSMLDLFLSMNRISCAFFTCISLQTVECGKLLKAIWEIDRIDRHRLRQTSARFDASCHSEDSVQGERDRSPYSLLSKLIIVDAQVVSAIERGLCVLIGVGTGIEMQTRG